MGMVSITDLVNQGYGCRSTILNQIHSGEFRAISPAGGKWLVDMDSYQRWLETKRRAKRHNYERRRR